MEEVQRRLAETSPSSHLKFESGKEVSFVYLNDDEKSPEGQVRFSAGRVIYAQYQMPIVQTSEKKWSGSES